MASECSILDSCIGLFELIKVHLSHVSLEIVLSIACQAVPHQELWEPLTSEADKRSTVLHGTRTYLKLELKRKIRRNTAHTAPGAWSTFWIGPFSAEDRLSAGEKDESKEMVSGDGVLFYNMSISHNMQIKFVSI